MKIKLNDRKSDAINLLTECTTTSLSKEMKTILKLI